MGEWEMCLEKHAKAECELCGKMVCCLLMSAMTQVQRGTARGT